jgi:hypothetical protein
VGGGGEGGEGGCEEEGMAHEVRGSKARGLRLTWCLAPGVPGVNTLRLQ